MLGVVVDEHTKSSIARNTGHLSAILESALDLRRQEALKYKLSDQTSLRLAELEVLIYEVAIRMIYKLNDATFRPMFSSLVDWATSGLPAQDRVGRVQRQQSFYGFLSALFDNLKSTVTNYAAYIVDGAANHLTRTIINDSEEMELWKGVLVALRKSFEHDQDEFWQAPAHFDTIIPVLADQFLHAPLLVKEVPDVLIPTVVSLAVAVEKSEEHVKTINRLMQKHMRSEQAPVRLAAVKCEQALVDALGEEWLSVLTEMLPYISELRDDDDEIVERETNRWIVKIEAVVGESLDPMLQ